MPEPIARYLALFKRLLFPLLLTGLVTIDFIVFVIRSGVNISPRATLYGMIYGYAERPFVYRALLPMLVRILSQLCPVSVSGLLSYLFHLPLLEIITIYDILRLSIRRQDRCYVTRMRKQKPIVFWI